MSDKIEERLAHLQRMVEELSDVVARQDSDMALMQRRLSLLLEREAQRDADGTGGVVLGDEQPPHY